MTSENTNKNEYVYFVSYSHSTGVGNIPVVQNAPMDSMDLIKRVTQIISQEHGSPIAINNFQLLSSPPVADPIVARLRTLKGHLDRADNGVLIKERDRALSEARATLDCLLAERA